MQDENHQVRRRRLHSEELTMSTAAGTSIYESIGGEPALTAVVDDLYQRVTADPKLAGFFAGTNMAKLKGRQVEFFAAALGGPQTYTGATIREAHRGRGIGQEHFDLVAGHLVAALSAANVPDKTINDITGLLGPLAKDIVSRAGS
jgi:hemoglobin